MNNNYTNNGTLPSHNSRRRGRLRTCALLLLALCLGWSVKAQDVTVVVQQKTANLPVTVASYADNFFNYFNILLTNSSGSTQSVYLTLDMECIYSATAEPMRIYTDDGNRTSRPRIDIPAGGTYLINTRQKFEEQFRGGRIATSSNLSQNSLGELLRLPEGNYNLCVKACQWSEVVTSDHELSNSCLSFQICYSGSAPEFTQPFGNLTTMPGVAPVGNAPVLMPSRNINIRWTGVVTNCPQNARFEYVLKIVKVLPNQNINDAIRRNPAAFSYNAGRRTYCLIDTMRNLNARFEPGALYVAQVEAHQNGNVANQMQLGNDGKSQIYAFYWGQSGGNGMRGRGDIPTGGEDDDDAETETGGQVDPNPGVPTQNVSTNETSNKDEILGKIRQHYIVSPGKDDSTITALKAKFSDESSNVPSGNDSIVKSKTPDGIAILDEKRKKDFAIRWIPAHYDSIKRVNYEVKLYEYLSSPEVTLAHSPIKSKTINGEFNYWYGLDNVDPKELKDTSWANALELGKKYYVTVDAFVSYTYTKTTITTTNFLNNGEVTSTEYDTAYALQSDAVHYRSATLFQWGIDKALLDKLNPAKFTYPVDKSLADWTDTTQMQFGFTIPEVPRYHTFNFAWNKATGEDFGDSLTYQLHVWKVKKGKTIKQIVKDTSTFKVKNIKELSCKDSTLLDSLKNGETYLARVYVEYLKDTNKYDRQNKGWSVPIVFKLVDTVALGGIIDTKNACFAADTAGLSKQLITPKIDTLISNRTRLKMGRFDMIIQDGKYNSQKQTYSGTGFVIWRPAGFGCNVKVHFDSIKINKDHRIVSGTARSIATDSNNYLKLNLGNNKYGAGFDMGSDYVDEYMASAANELGNTGQDIQKWYNIINQGSNPISEMIHSGIEGDFSIGTVTTPITVNDKMFGSDAENIRLAVNDLFFSPVTAQMNLLCIFGAPQDNVYIPLLATNICITPDAFYHDTANDLRLFSPRNYEFELSDGYVMRFKMPSDFAEVKDGTYISWNKKGFKEINIDVEIELGRKGQDGNKLLAVDLKNNGQVSPTKPVKAYLTTKFKKWGDWIAKIKMDPFTVVGCEDWTFLPTGSGIWYDHSSTETPKGIQFPKNYNKKNQEKQWQGFYMDRFSVLLPADVTNTFIDLNGEKDDMPDSTLVYKYGANGEKTDSVAYAYPGTRIGLGAQHLIIDGDGISVELVGTDLLKLETRNGGGWKFSIDTVSLCFEKNKYKYGKIHGGVDLPLFTGGLNYDCFIGSDSLVFAITPADTLKLDLFLAKIELDKKSSYFKVNHDYGGHTWKQEWDGVTTYTMLNQNATTRVDLTLNGKIDIDMKKIGLDVSLPGIKFENMYMRNFRAKKVNTAKGEVEAYKFGDMDFSIGNWSKASPQKFIGCDYDEMERQEAMVDALAPTPEGEKPIFSGQVSGFKYSVNTLTPTFEQVKGKSGTYKVGIDFAGTMEIGIGAGMSVGASAGFGINCEVNTDTWDVSNWGGTFDSARVKTDIGPLSVDGFIGHTRNDPVFGNSWRGTVKVKVMDVIECSMGAGFGTKAKEKGSGDYDWWFFEGAVDMGNASPMVLGPVTITGFGGGFAYNCKPKQSMAGMSAKNMMKGNFMSNMVSSSGSNYTPCYDAWMAKCGIALAMTGDPTTLNADGTLNLRIANGHFSGICLQVNCRIMSTYNDTTKVGSGGIVEVGAFIDYTKFDEGGWAFTFSAICKSQLNMNSFLKNAAVNKLPAKISYPEFSMGDGSGCMSKYVEPYIQKSMDYDSVKAKVNKYNAGQIGASASLQIPIDLYISKKPSESTKWFFALGRPAYDDRIKFSASFDLVVCNASTAWTFYFMTGNYFPEGFAMPDIPTDVANFLGDKYLSRAEGSRKLPTFKNAGGFAVGASFYASIEFSLLLYLKATTYIGFDAAVINTNGEGCENYSKIGKNGYYGMGQAYVMFQGEAGLALNLGFWKGKISLVEAGLGAIVQAGGPNPTWAFGMLRFKASCLGGLIKINTAVDFELGHTCVPGASDPLANVKLFQSVTPAYSYADYSKPEKIVQPTTTGTVVSNMPWNQDVLLSAMDDKAKTVTRKFRFVLDKSMSQYEYWGKQNNQWKWIKRSLRISGSSTDENTLYFEDWYGGFPESTTLWFHLYARVFEYRKSKDNKLSDWYMSRDSIYYVCDNYAYSRSGNPKNYSGSYGWRKPLYTDNGTTYFNTRRYYQDTAFYLKTSTPPENLYDQVVFTWPYNGDPQVPYQELHKSGGRYYALIYIYNDRNFLDPNKLDADGRQIMAFLVENGWGEQAEAQKCDYYYYKNGYLGSNMPCIAVRLPYDFSPYNYQNHNLAVRLMLVKKSDYQAQLNALNGQANNLMTQTRYENQQRSNLSQLRNEYYAENSSASNRGTSVSQYGGSYGRGAGTGEGSTTTKFNLKLAQLREATNAYSGVRDTAMNFSRKSLASGYVAAVRAGAAVYNLYFRLCSGIDTYDDVLSRFSLSELFSLSSSDCQHDGKSVKTFTVLKNGNGYTTNAEDYAKRHAYLFSEWEPNNPLLYKTGVRLPAIMHAAFNYELMDVQYKPEVKIYQKYYRAMADVNAAIKNTTAPYRRPKQECSEKWHDIFCGGLGGKNWKDWTDYGERSRVSTAAAQGLVRLNGNSNFSAMTTRLDTKTYSNQYKVRQWDVYQVLVPQIYDATFQGAPRLLRFQTVDQKGRVDSTILLGQSKQYRMSDNRIVYSPEMSYSAKWKVIDEATGAMVQDIKYYHEFFQTLVDYGIYMHGRGYSHKVSELNELMKQSRYMITLDFSTCPLTFAKSVFGMWWMNSFQAQHKSNEAYLKEIKRSYYKPQPYIPRNYMTAQGGAQALYWQDYVLHMNQIPYEVNKTKGTCYEDLFTTNGKYYGGHDFTWFKTANYDGIVGNNYISDGGRYYDLDAYWFSPNASGYSNSMGYMANRTKETIHNSDAHPFVVTKKKSKAGLYWFKINSTFVNTLKTVNGLTFRTTSSGAKDWWE